MIGPFFQNNLKKIKFTYLSFLIISLIIQLFLLENYNNIFSIFYLFASNLLVFFYCLNANNIRNFTISTFSILYICFYTNCSAIFFKSIFFESIDKNLFDPNFSFLFLFISNLILIFIHIFYKQLIIFKNLKNFFQKIFLKFGVEQAKEKNYLFFIGIFSLGSAFIFYTFFGEFIYSDIFNEPNLLGDILNATNIFFICPFIVLYTSNIYKYNLTKKNIFLILISFLFIFFLSLGLNARSAFFDIFFVGILIYSLLFITGVIEIKVLRLNKIFFIILLCAIVATTIDRFSTTYLDVRDLRDKTNPIKNIQNHFNSFLSGTEKNNKLTTQKIFKEDYYGINILNRINIVKPVDNLLFANQFLNKAQKDELLNYDYGKIVSLVPNPIIKIFDNSFNKSFFLKNTITSRIYKYVDKYFLGGKSNGLSFPIFLIYKDSLIFIIFVFSVFISFSFLDSLKYKNQYFIIFFIFLYSTSGGLINFIASGSISDLLGSLLRVLPQGIFVFLITNFFYRKFTNKV